MTKKPANFITTAEGMSGWVAVMYWWNDEDPELPEGFWEPWDTGLRRYRNEAKAIEEAQTWADAEGLEYVPRETKAPGS